MNIKTTKHKKLHKLVIAIVGIFICIFFVFGYVTFLDPEWQDWQLREQIRDNHKLLRIYKNTHSKYPDSLVDAKAVNRFCILFKCFDIQYKVSEDKRSYKSVAKANSPFIVFFDSTCPSIPDLGEDYKSFCVMIGLEENYHGNRTDLPIYLKNKKWFPNTLGWPQL